MPFEEHGANGRRKPSSIVGFRRHGRSLGSLGVNRRADGAVPVAVSISRSRPRRAVISLVELVVVRGDGLPLRVDQAVDGSAQAVEAISSEVGTPMLGACRGHVRRLGLIIGAVGAVVATPSMRSNRLMGRGVS